MKELGRAYGIRIEYSFNVLLKILCSLVMGSVYSQIIFNIVKYKTSYVINKQVVTRLNNSLNGKSCSIQGCWVFANMECT